MFHVMINAMDLTGSKCDTILMELTVQFVNTTHLINFYSAGRAVLQYFSFTKRLLYLIINISAMVLNLFRFIK